METSLIRGSLSGKAVLWAKTSTRNGVQELSPVYVHLLDTAFCYLAFFKALPPVIQAKLLALVPWLPADEALKFLAFIAAAHDIGKISPVFQAKVEVAKRLLEQNGYQFPRGYDASVQKHDEVTRMSLVRYLRDRLGFDYDSADTLAGIAAAHHSRLSEPDELNEPRGSAWTEAQDETLDFVAKVLGLDLDTLNVPENVDCALDCRDSGAMLLFAGMISVADWIASNEEAFPFQSEVPDDLDGYVAERRACADEAIARLHLQAPLPGSTELDDRDFRKLFGLSQGAEPNQLQRAAVDFAAESPCPGMIIVETPMGSGKTEAALLAYLERLRYGARGLYYGLPTQTTGNMMFGRVNTFLRSAFGDQAVESHLLHADAFLSDLYNELKVAWTGPRDHESGIVATDWFCGAKRGLLAAHGVGTVDQAMLAAVKSKHFFVRLFGLAGKVVVIDEVHAYDVYMREIIVALIKWLRALDCEVVLLSATLGRKWRNQLIRAYDPSAELEDVPYPSVTSIRPGYNPRVIEIAPDAFHKEIELELRRLQQDDCSRAIAEAALKSVSDGGCAACVCNTVKRAQEVYRLIKELDPSIDLRIFHAKYTRADRRAHEQSVVSAFGPEGNRPQRAIVVASQVIEQSLDLDFDVMLTELAPIDLLLQRFGRLQRHRRSRPAHPAARAIVFCPPALSPECFGTSAYVYEAVTLARSLLALEAHGTKLIVPDEVQDLVEAVYGDRETLADAALEGLMAGWEKKADGDAVADVFFGRNAIIPSPDIVSDAWSSVESLQSLGDDTMPIGTRLARPSVEVALIEDSSSGDVSALSIGAVLDRCVKIDNKKWYSKLRERVPFAPWKDRGPLRYVLPLALNDGLYRDGDEVLKYDAELGLELLKGGAIDDD